MRTLQNRQHFGAVILHFSEKVSGSLCDGVKVALKRATFELPIVPFIVGRNLAEPQAIQKVLDSLGSGASRRAWRRVSLCCLPLVGRGSLSLAPS